MQVYAPTAQDALDTPWPGAQRICFLVPLLKFDSQSLAMRRPSLQVVLVVRSFENERLPEYSPATLNDAHFAAERADAPALSGATASIARANVVARRTRIRVRVTKSVIALPRSHAVAWLSRLRRGYPTEHSPVKP